MKMLLAASAMALIAAPALAQVMTPAEYVAAAGASDLFEQQSGQLVLQSSADAKVKAFADMMVTDHGKSTAEVKAAAAKSNVPAMAPKLMPVQAELIAQLRAVNGPARDALYVAQQKAAHGQALAVQQAYAMEGSAPALKMAAGDIVPVVQHHIEMLKGM